MAKMQGIILEVYDKWAVILDTDGQYKKVKIKGPVQVGELWTGYALPGWKSAVAAVVMLALLGFSLDFCAVVAYAEMSSGVKIGINRWDRVVSVQALHPEASKYLEKSNLTGLKADQAVARVVTETVGTQPNQGVTQANPLLKVTSTRADERNQQRLTRKLDHKIKKVIIKKGSPGAAEQSGTIGAPEKIIPLGQYKKNTDFIEKKPERSVVAPAQVIPPGKNKSIQPRQNQSTITKPEGQAAEKGQSGIKHNKTNHPVLNELKQNPAGKIPVPPAKKDKPDKVQKDQQKINQKQPKGRSK